MGMSPLFTCTDQHVAGVTRLSLGGELGLPNLQLFRTRMKTAAAAGDNVVLELSAVRYIDSTGIHALLDAYQMLTLTGHCMALAAVPPKVQRALVAFGADEILPAFPTVEAAVENLGLRGAPK